MRLYIGLIHYPVYNKNEEVIASAITTLDLHDMARVAKTYEVRQFFVITPLEDQQELAQRVQRHWTEGYGATYNPLRKEAIELVSVVSSLSEARSEIEEREGEPPLCVATDAARQQGRGISWKALRDLLEQEKTAILLFGTAWGLHKTVIEGADYVLEPIWGKRDYNHLSVRSAAAILLDRLAGRNP